MTRHTLVWLSILALVALFTTFASVMGWIESRHEKRLWRNPYAQKLTLPKWATLLLWWVVGIALVGITPVLLIFFHAGATPLFVVVGVTLVAYWLLAWDSSQKR